MTEDQDAQADEIESLIEEGAFFVPWDNLNEDAKRRIPRSVRLQVRSLPKFGDEVACALVIPTGKGFGLRKVVFMRAEDWAEIEEENAEKARVAHEER